MPQTYYSIYSFMAELSEVLPPKAVVLSDAGNTGFVTSQAIKLREGMRYITSGGQMDMGFALPASIGVSRATTNKVVPIIGDGSFQLNMQELGTIALNKLPICIVIINNNGYGCCRNTQKKFFKSNFIGNDPESGLGLPSIKNIAEAYGIEYRKYNPETLGNVLNINKPVILEVFTDPDEKIKSAYDR